MAKQAEIDPDLLAAMREVDAMTPSVPPMAPTMAPTMSTICGSQYGRYVCVQPAEHGDEYCFAALASNSPSDHPFFRYRGPRTYWPNPHRGSFGINFTGNRPPETWIDYDASVSPVATFVLSDGRRVPVDRVQRDGWYKVLAGMEHER